MGNQMESNWQEEYEFVEELQSNCRKVKSKANPTKFYELVSIHTNQQGWSKLKERLTSRERDKNIYIQKLIKSYTKQQSYLCSDTLPIDLVFRQAQPTLAHHCKYRLLKKQPFRNEQIFHVIRYVALGLKYLGKIGEKHGLIELNSIVVNEEIYIKDPIVVQSENQDGFRLRKSIKGFPSPQKLREQYDMVINCEEQSWDLFSLGMVALQMLYLDVNLQQAYRVKNVAYSNRHFDFAFVNRLINCIQDRRLKEWICILLHPQERKRKTIYQYFNEYQYNIKKLKILRQDPFKFRPQDELIQPIEPFQEPKPDHHRQSVSVMPISHRFPTIGFNDDRDFVVGSFAKETHGFRQLSQPLVQIQQPKHTYINQSFNYTTQINLTPQTIPNQPIDLSSLTSSLAQLSQNLKSLIQAQELQLSQKSKIDTTAVSTQKSRKGKDFQLRKRTSLYTDKLVPIIPQVQEDHSNITQCSFVIEEYEIGTKYQGFKKNGKRNGNGKFYYSQGSCYQGQWKDNKMDGLGKLTYPNGSLAYQGGWKDDEFQGQGILYNNQSTPIEADLNYSDLTQINSLWAVYQGDMHCGKRNGLGKMTFVNGDYFEGRFFQDQIDGEGTFYCNQGNAIYGKWAKGVLTQLYSNQ